MLQKKYKIALLLILAITLSACATGYDKHGVHHKVREGESIRKIARYYKVPVQDLAEWNNIQDPKLIRPGLKLYIPKTGKDKNHNSRTWPLGHVQVKQSPKKYTNKIRLEKSRFSWPVNGRIMSPFGIRNGRRHDGVDLKAKSGTPIKAAAKGEVAYSGRLSGYGNVIILKHKDGYFTVYAHNRKNKVKKGQKVAKNRLIGYVGSTGRSSGPHLHFEVRRGSKARNPLFFLPGSDAGVALAAKQSVKKKEQKRAEKKPLKKEKIAKVEPKQETKVVKNKFSRRQKMMDALRAKKRK